MNDTPRTDAACMLGYMPANFARQLERELNAALTENTTMRDAIKTAHDDLLKIATMPEYDQDDCHRLRNLGMKAASKLQQIITIWEASK